MKTILIIEDNPDILENIKEILELSDYSVRVARNGKEGITEAVNAVPDVILCDITMPEADGYEVLKTLKRNTATQEIPLIFVTASVEKREVEAAMKMGVAGYIKKPFEAGELMSVVGSMI